MGSNAVSVIDRVNTHGSLKSYFGLVVHESFKKSRVLRYGLPLQSDTISTVSPSTGRSSRLLVLRRRNGELICESLRQSTDIVCYIDLHTVLSVKL